MIRSVNPHQLGKSSHLLIGYYTSAFRRLRLSPPITGKLELPSLSQVQTRGPVDVPWYNHHSAQRPLTSSERLPSLSFTPAYSSSTSYSSPRLNSLGSSSILSGSSHTSNYTNGNPAHGLKTPSPTETSHALPEQSLAPNSYAHPNNTAHGLTYGQDSYNPHTMNHNQSWDMHQPHLSAGPQHAPSTATTGGMPQYSYSQPPLLQPGPNTYASNPYPQYGYANGITSPQPAVNPVSAPMGSGMGSHLLPLPGLFPSSFAAEHSFILTFLL